MSGAFLKKFFKISFIVFFLLLVFIVVYSLFFKASIYSENQIGVLEIDGIITTSDSFLDQIDKFEENKKIKALVIRINSPGGGVVPSQEIYDSILKFKKRTKKKVVVSMGSLAASGGYYIACAADRIVANPGTITGSIGVIMQFSNMKRLFDKLGLTFVTVKSGRFKDIGSPMRSMSKEERAILQNVINNIYKQFVDVVSKNRHIPRKKVLSIADGRIFTGVIAKKLGLVDVIGSLKDAIQIASSMAGIVGKPEIVRIKKRMFFLKKLFSLFGLSSNIYTFVSFQPLYLLYQYSD